MGSALLTAIAAFGALWFLTEAVLDRRWAIALLPGVIAIGLSVGCLGVMFRAWRSGPSPEKWVVTLVVAAWMTSVALLAKRQFGLATVARQGQLQIRCDTPAPAPDSHIVAEVIVECEAYCRISTVYFSPADGVPDRRVFEGGGLPSRVLASQLSVRDRRRFTMETGGEFDRRSASMKVWYEEMADSPVRGFRSRSRETPRVRLFAGAGQ